MVVDGVWFQPLILLAHWMPLTAYLAWANCAVNDMRISPSDMGRLWLVNGASPPVYGQKSKPSLAEECFEMGHLSMR